MINEGDYIINKRGTIGKVTDLCWGTYTIRKVSTTIGKFTKKKNTPYTFQSKINTLDLSKTWKKINTETILKILWKYKEELK